MEVTSDGLGKTREEDEIQELPDSFEGLAYGKTANLRRVSLREKRMSLFCFNWINKRRSLTFQESESAYMPTNKKL